jgi:nucleoside-diphosphate-sugar epimerase
MAADQRLAVLRPPIIYGPGDRETLALFRLAAQAQIMPIPASEAARVALAHVDDVSAAVLDLLDRPNLAGVFAVPGARPEGYAWREIAAAACQAAGRSPALLAVPGWAAMAAASLSELMGAFSRAAPIFTTGKVKEMLHDDWSVSPSEQAPGAPPARFSLEAGFADAVEWYREAGWLTPVRSE